MKIEKVAKLCHEVNRAYCQSLNDFSQSNWEDAPSWQKESAIKGVKYHLENEDTTPADSHKNWVIQKLREGWTVGSKKDPIAKKHPCLVAFDKLPKEQKAKDFIFHAIITFFKDD